MRLSISLTGCAAALLASASAHAGPTVAAEFNLGTPVGVESNTRTITTPTGPVTVETAGRPALGVIGVSFRAGWCFDVGPHLFLLPELGIEYDVERGAVNSETSATADGHVSRFFVGGRVGISKPVHPILRLEPALFTHAGVGWYAIGADAPTLDAGLALGLRIKERILVGAQLGYSTVGLRGDRDQWLDYGLHAGARFW